MGSFTRTHAIPSSLTGEQRQRLKDRRKQENALGVDGWLLEGEGKAYFRLLCEIQDWMLASAAEASAAGRCEVWLSRYEDMVEHTKEWTEKLIQHLDFTDEKAQQILRDVVRKNERVK